MPRVSILTKRRRLLSAPIEQLNGELDDALLLIAPMLTPLALAKHASLPPALQIETIELEDGLCTIAHRGWNFYRKPLGGSPGSGAEYLVVRSFGDTLAVVQRLKKGLETSSHFHVRERERFYPIAGSCILHRGPVLEDHGLARKEESLPLAVLRENHFAKFSIPPWVAHQLQTGREGALNLIVIHPTSARTLQELDHRPVRWVA